MRQSIKRDSSGQNVYKREKNKVANVKNNENASLPAQQSKRRA